MAAAAAAAELLRDLAPEMGPVKSLKRLDVGRVALWRNGRALDLRSRGRKFDLRVGAQLRNDYGQVVHTRLPRRRQSSYLQLLNVYLYKTNRTTPVPPDVSHCAVVISPSVARSCIAPRRSDSEKTRYRQRYRAEQHVFNCVKHWKTALDRGSTSHRPRFELRH